jgi:hypothetical protein
LLPGRLVPHVLRVAALELGHPMPFVILVESHDPSVHEPGRPGRSGRRVRPLRGVRDAV